MIASVALTQAASTSYGAEHQLPGARILQLTVNNAAVIIQLGRGQPGVLWAPEQGSFRIPGVHTIPGPVDAIRVASAVSHAGGSDAWPTYSVDAY